MSEARPLHPRPQIDEARVIRTVAGLRPYRPAGFVVRAERMDGKMLVHHYGHGGCGVTLSWGTAQQARALALEQPQRRAAVLGCGAVGLATARLLQDAGFDVTIYTRDLPPDTTSNIAGALWAPYTIVGGAHRDALAEPLAAASRGAHRYFQTLVGPRYGVRWLPLYLFGDNPNPRLPWEWSLTPELFPIERVPDDEHDFPFPVVRRVWTMLIEPPPYLRALMADFRRAGGRIVVRDFPDPRAVAALDEPVVVNCTGLGSHTLFDDRTLTPVKGQLVFLVPQPELDYMYIGGGYLMPRTDGVLLGGTHDRGDWTTTTDPAVTRRILEQNRPMSAAAL